MSNLLKNLDVHAFISKIIDIISSAVMEGEERDNILSLMIYLQ